MSQKEGKIQGLFLSNFTCFADLEVNFSEGINVIIGENGLGKTHLLKALFNTFSNRGKHQISSSVDDQDSVTNLIVNAYDPNTVTSIWESRDNTSKILLSFLNIFGIKDKNELKRNKLNDWQIFINQDNGEQDRVFIPTYEMLSWYKGFISSYENRESSIDYVYYLLAKKLAPLPLKGDKLKEQKLLIHELENELGFEVVRDGDEFMIAFAKDQVHNTKLVANGINKLAQLIYLIMNGSLTKNSIIFWDEPEAGLNPKYIVLVAKFLQTLVKAGCQIFVATHDYLLSHTLSLAAEYRDVQPETPAMRFHALYKTAEGTQIESADTLPQIEHNSILDEYSHFYKIEEELFYQSMKVKE